MRVFCVIFMMLVTSGLTYAQQAPVTEQDQAQIEQRARDIGRALRCVVCQNQSIEESDASLAEDMRRLVRARVRAGDSKAEVIAYMQNRYGDYVLLKPPVQSNTYFLWFAPFGLMLLGLLWFLRQSRPQDKTLVKPLTTGEREAVDKLEGNI